MLRLVNKLRSTLGLGAKPIAVTPTPEIGPSAPAPAMTLSVTSPLRHAPARSATGAPPSVVTLTLLQADLLEKAESVVRDCVERDELFTSFAFVKSAGNEILPLVCSTEFDDEQDAFVALLHELFALRDAGRMEAVVIARPMPLIAPEAPESVVFDLEHRAHNRVLVTLSYWKEGSEWAFEKVLKAEPARMLAGLRPVTQA